jgi:hypothetical protein
MQKQSDTNSIKPYSPSLEVQKERHRKADCKLLQIIQALAGVLGGALWFADLASPLNISKAIQTVSLMVLGGILGYFTFLLSKHK